MERVRTRVQYRLQCVQRAATPPGRFTRNPSASASLNCRGIICMPGASILHRPFPMSYISGQHAASKWSLPAVVNRLDAEWRECQECRAVYPMRLGPGRSRSIRRFIGFKHAINCDMGTSCRSHRHVAILHSIDSRDGRDLHQTVRDSGMFPSIVWSRDRASFTTPGTGFAIRRACGNHAIPSTTKKALLLDSTPSQGGLMGCFPPSMT